MTSDWRKRFKIALVFTSCVAVFCIYQQSTGELFFASRNVSSALQSLSFPSFDIKNSAFFRKNDPAKLPAVYSNITLKVINEEDLLKILSENCNATPDKYHINMSDTVLSINEYKKYQAEKFIEKYAIPFPNLKLAPLSPTTKVSLT